MIIPELLQENSAREAAEQAARMPLNDYALFKLIISDRDTLIECIWDGSASRTIRS